MATLADDDDSVDTTSGDSSYNLTYRMTDDEECSASPKSKRKIISHNAVSKHFISRLYGKIVTTISIEPMMFLQMVGFSSTSVVVQNLYIDRICRISFSYPDSICGNLTSTPQGFRSY